ncbi:MAG: bifunctional 2-methylcitrate synthase/citrate synthase [Proteobacteria bacterium]|nr:bifunctional 2-methylcitrate synthase/citrate synthase [Pseudomonadota bacterium]
MAEQETKIYRGLDGVVVDETAVSKVMPETNSLTYRGYAVQDLAANCRFEEVAYLIWFGELPTQTHLDAFIKKERGYRSLSDDLLAAIRLYPKDSHPMDTIRTSVSFLGMEDPEAENNDPAINQDKAIKLFARIPTAVAADYRCRKGLDPIPPDPSLGFAENFFHMCFGEVPEPEVIRCFDISMTLYAEHSFNASTFASRVITSTLSDMYSAVTGAIGALKGPLHGGANEAVMHMLLEIGSSNAAQQWIDNALANKGVVMGFGHRVYKNGDSRVPTMHDAFVDMAKIKDGEDWVRTEKIVADTMLREKDIHPNLDYPAGPAYYLMGFDIDLFTPIFVVSRITGWSAHVMEQLAANRLIRPLSAYNGQAQRKVPAIDKR